MIDEKVLIEDLSKWKDSLEDPQPFDESGVIIRNVLEAVIDIINDQPTIQQLEELEEYKSLGFSPEEVAMLARFFKERTSTAAITADMKLLAGYLKAEKYEELEKQNKMPQTGWIPCSERLPDTADKGLYPINLVTLETGEVCIGVYRHNECEWVTRRNSGEILYTTEHNVIAWQPLPQPYKEG